MISGNELVIISTYFYLTEHRADNFIVGLTNVPPTVRAPTLSVVSTQALYHLELQSPCSVPVKPLLITCTTSESLVLYLQCTCGLSAYRYLIVQFPSTDGYANLCELEVYIRRKESSYVYANKFAIIQLYCYISVQIKYRGTLAT